MLDRVRIRTLREAGHTLKEIAASVGVAKRSVQNVLREPPITGPEEAPTPRSRGIGRPSTVRSYQGDVERILKEEPALPTVEVLSRLRGLGYSPGAHAMNWNAARHATTPLRGATDGPAPPSTA